MSSANLLNLTPNFLNEWMCRHVCVGVSVCVCTVLWATDKGGELNQSPVLLVASIDLQFAAPLISDPKGSHYAPLGLFSSILITNPHLRCLQRDFFFHDLVLSLYVKHLVIHLSLDALPGPHTRYIIIIISISIKVQNVHKHTRGHCGETRWCTSWLHLGEIAETPVGMMTTVAKPLTGMEFSWRRVAISLAAIK